MEKGKSVGAVRQAVAILRMLGQHPQGLGANETARRTTLNPSTVYNILRTLVDERLVSFDESEKRYRIGIGALQIAGAHEALSLVDIFRPELVRIATNFECLTVLWRFTSDDRAILIERVLADTPIRLDIRVVERMPSASGAVGRAYAAAMQWPIDALRAHFAPLRWANPMPFEVYRAEVEEARRRGFGVDVDALYAGITSVGSVAVDHAGRPHFGLSAIMVTRAQSAETINRIGEALAATCQAARGLTTIAA